jgi:multicomponent Na+:H+ antiporter subunit F
MSETVVLVFAAGIVAGIILCLLRLLRGPTASDRAVAADTACTVTTALLVFMGFVFKRYVYLDVSLVYAVLTFIGALAIARFLERGI